MENAEPVLTRDDVYLLQQVAYDLMPASQSEEGERLRREYAERLRDLADRIARLVAADQPPASA